VSVINFVLLILALVCFLLATFAGHAGAAPDGRPVAWTRTNFVALGLAFWVATAIIAAFPH
jgi:hypothetical protein